MRSVHDFNDGWLYIAQEVDDNTPDSDFTAVTIPHTNVDLPYHNFDDKEYEFISTYRKRFTLPEEREGRRIYLDFGAVMTAATVTLNGHTFAEYKGGFTPFSFDITDYLNKNGDNFLTVSVDSTERADIPPHGGRVDYLVFGGIYREVSLRYVEPVHIMNVRVRTLDVLTDNPRLEVDVWVTNTSDSPQQFNVDAVIITTPISERSSHIGDAHVNSDDIAVELPSGQTQSVSFNVDLNGSDWVRLWTLNKPILYSAGVYLRHGGEVNFDAYNVIFGFREAQFREDGFYLNGEKLFLRGLNRHQFYPFIGTAAPKRLQERDAEIVKEMGCNIVRTSHYPQSKHFINRCDEIGLLVLEEIPGWQFIGDEAWKEISLRDVRAMIERDWNSPSIILWGVRINESWDDHDFYTRTNALAHELDSTRQTGGIRFRKESEFLEDVFTYNDFSNGIIEPLHSPWMVTEYNGHMFPTKTFDNEERQVEHMRRHAHVQAQAMTMGGVAGAIGWCAFDYNTHVDFGSGDRICYHGVMDIFRQPKWAAYVYRSQKSPDEEIVLQAATFWTMGDRSGGGNDPLYVMTNCDAVDMYVGDEHHGRFEANGSEFPTLPHPPIKITGFGTTWGAHFQTLRLVGIRNGEAVAEQIIPAESLPSQLVAYVEDETLKADAIDMTRLVFKIVDEYGNRLPYAIQVVTLELLEGDAQIIGTNPFPLVGGQAALFIKAGRTPGKVVVRVSTPRLEPVEVTLTLE
jgi:beta-galactosidase